MKRALLLSSLLFCVGCIGDPDVEQTSAELALTVPVRRVDWERAPAGCEGLDGLEAELRRCAGEQLLGALVGPTGRVLCVDSLTLLADERLHPRVERDPTPTPLMEGSLDRRSL